MIRYLTTAAICLAALPLAAEPVHITRDVMSITVPLEGGATVDISRIQDNDHRLEGDWDLTSRPCPNFCIQPMVPAEGVTAIGELELLEMLQDPNTVVADGRVRPEYLKGTIPGAISVPYT